MTFDVGEILIIIDHPISEAIGKEVEVLVVNTTLLAPEVWYVVQRQDGRRHAASHPQLRRRGWGELQCLLQWQPQEETT